MRKLCGAALVLLARHASAEDVPAPGQSPEKVRLLYQAPQECPAAADFVGEVRSRLGSAWEAGEGELARIITVKVEKRAERYVAELEFTDSAGQKITRAVSGMDCAVVADGMALVTSLAIQARVDEALSQSEAVESSAPERKPEAALTPAKEAPPAPAPEQGRKEPAPTTTTLAVQAGAMAGVRTGIGPALAFGAGGFFGVVWNRVTLELGFDWFAADTQESSSYPAEFQLLAAELDVCPLSHDLVRNLELTACALGEVGALSGEGVVGGAIVEGEEATKLWLAPGALARLQLLLDPLLVRLEGSGRFPLLLHKFHVESASGPQKIHEVPPFSLGAAIGLGVRFQ